MSAADLLSEIRGVSLWTQAVAAYTITLFCLGVIIFLRPSNFFGIQGIDYTGWRVPRASGLILMLVSPLVMLLPEFARYVRSRMEKARSEQEAVLSLDMDNELHSEQVGYFLGGRPGSVVAAVPMYNNEEHIGQIVRRTKEFVHQVVVVDDNSTDNSAEMANEAGAIVLKHQEHKGFASSVQTALRYAKRHNSHYVVVITQQEGGRPSEILRMVKHQMKTGADAVVGSHASQIDLPFKRRIGRHILSILFYISSRGVRLIDTEAAFHLYTNRAIDAILDAEVEADKNSFLTGFLIIISNSGLTIDEIDILPKQSD